MEAKRFAIAVADEILLDLRRRLAATRWPDEIDGAGWEYGTNLRNLKILVAYWSDCGGDVERRFTKDEMLTTITIYWVTETINSSVRMYYEGIRIPPLSPEQRIEVPAGVVIPPKDRTIPPREWAERSLRMQRWTEMPRGGHFAAMEEPELLVEEVRALFHPLRPARPDQLWCRWRSSRGHRLAVLHPRGGGAS